VALSQGTNYSYTPPKPPKPAGGYGAPSGPYAQPSMGDPVQAQTPSLGYPGARGPITTTYGTVMLPQAAPQPGYQTILGSALPGRPPVRRDPTTLGHMDSAIFAANLIASLAPFGPGPELAGLKGGIKGVQVAREVTSPAATLQKAAEFDRGMRGYGSYGIGNRAEMLNAADAKGYTLGAMLRGEQPPLIQRPFTTQKTAGKARNMVGPQNRSFGIREIGGVNTPTRTPNPMQNRYFRYTGVDEHVDPDRHVQEMRDAFGPGSDDFADAYDDFLNSPIGGGRPSGLHNIHDQHGNTIGSLTYEVVPSEFGRHLGYTRADEAYIRPEYRKGMEGVKNFKKLIQPLVDMGAPIDATFANSKLGEVFGRMVERGDMKSTRATMNKLKHPDPIAEVLGIPDPGTGLYSYEQAKQYLPRLMGPATARYTPALMGGLGRQLQYGRRTGGL